MKHTVVFRRVKAESFDKNHAISFPLLSVVQVVRRSSDEKKNITQVLKMK